MCHEWFMEINPTKHSSNCTNQCRIIKEFLVYRSDEFVIIQKLARTESISFHRNNQCECSLFVFYRIKLYTPMMFFFYNIAGD